MALSPEVPCQVTVPSQSTRSGLVWVASSAPPVAVARVLPLASVEVTVRVQVVNGKAPTLAGRARSRTSSGRASQGRRGAGRMGQPPFLPARASSAPPGQRTGPSDRTTAGKEPAAYTRRQ